MKIQIDSPLRDCASAALHVLSSILVFVIRRWRRRIPVPMPPPEQLTFDLDHAPAADLPLRDALPVRSAEYALRANANS